ncbi:hypothetical protein NC796_07590 [Aliifodinibius sp. S!AR15-10]|uniref:hypothetical protein n=1 Tax=Aliifodinibius sp. S!AR15-10 TaxID=2950437 RepID=UPI0028669D28|nr:hypothetical protein [Aliifodinibius sp. S!AR15-10]MDR8390994.1 hypothetical protein [Aliifodinibius sp. S!AR15-10]
MNGEEKKILKTLDNRVERIESAFLGDEKMGSVGFIQRYEKRQKEIDKRLEERENEVDNRFEETEEQVDENTEKLNKIWYYLSAAMVAVGFGVDYVVRIFSK